MIFYILFVKLGFGEEIEILSYFLFLPFLWQFIFNVTIDYINIPLIIKT